MRFPSVAMGPPSGPSVGPAVPPGFSDGGEPGAQAPARDPVPRVDPVLVGRHGAAAADYLALLNQDQSGEPVEPERAGLARELARVVLPLNTYTEWYWKTDLHNLLHFIALRADPHAQYEIRAYALVLLDVVRRWVPLTWRGPSRTTG